MSKDSNQMTQSDAARIQSTQAKGGNDMSSNGFAARAQSAGDRNANNAAADTTTSNSSNENINSNTGGNGGDNTGSAQGSGSDAQK